MRRAIIPSISFVALAAVVLIAWAPGQAAPRVFGMVTASVEPGQMSEYLTIVEQRIVPFLAEQDVELIGVFRHSLGGPSNEVLLLLAYRDLAHVQAVTENTQLTEIQQQTFEGMRVLRSWVLQPVSFSPLQ